MAAKDVIDGQVSVAALDPEAALVEPLRAIGFVPHTIDRDHRPRGRDGPAADWAKRLLVETPGQRRVNVHLRVNGRPNQRYLLLLRDYLAHDEAATSYATLKRRLAELSVETGAYADVKDPVSDLIMEAAEEWAETGWQPGPSDG